MCNSKEDGGLKMTNIPNFIDGLKIAWVKRYLDENNKGTWKLLSHNDIEGFGGDWIWLCRPEKHTDFWYDKMCNTFLSDVLKAWFRLRKSSDDKISDQVIWYNSSIKINRKTVFYKTWSTKGINFISNLRVGNQRFMSYIEFKTTFDINCNFMKYFGLIHALSTCFDKQLTDHNPSHESKLLSQLKNAQRVTSFAYQLLNNVLPPKHKGSGRMSLNIQQV
jgi:hypothetical protein